MNEPKKEEPKPAPVQAQPTPAPQVTPAPGFNNQQATGQNVPAPAPQAQLDPANEIVAGHQNKEAIVAELEGMGFDKPLIEQALAAAFYNKERAVDYLLNVS